ncbi:MAG: aminoacetone oxidase family FAD-binding enzyme [Clostridiales bacterium]|nr:aminoacetone oxidase family FAD-binding enzyme [Clostridiales bacterium]
MSGNDGKIYDLLIVGAGASGMSAAISFQKERKALGLEKGQVLILEKNDRVGKKVLATGNGRCNLSNKEMSLAHFHSRRDDFPKTVFSHVPQQAVLSFLSDIGIVTTSEGNKIFPMSKTAASVVDAFRYALEDNSIEVISDAVVSSIAKDSVFHVSCEDGKTYSAGKLIVACGGACSPNLGTSGDGYKWLSSLGHKVYAPKPSIVQLETENAVAKALSGLRLDSDLTLVADGDVVAGHFGEVLFTDYGLSGPAVLQVSGEVARRIRKDRLTVPMKVCLRLFDEEMLSNIRVEFISRRDHFGSRSLDQILLSILPQKIGTMIVKTALDRPLSMPILSLSDQDIEKIISTLRSWEFRVLGTKSLEFAQTTIGGADCDEFDPETMQSLLVPGLYACGEVLDVDGDCGGYNLTWAFASGILAGSSCASEKAGETDGD